MNRREAKELDAMIAECVMGWKRGRSFGNGNGEWIATRADGSEWRPTWDHTPWFSTDIAHAWKVVEKMRERFSLWLLFSRQLQREVSRRLHETELVAHDFVWRLVTPADICRAALCAVGDGRPVAGATP